MKIIKKSSANLVKKPEGTDVRYYLRDEYEIMDNIIHPHTTQTWHHHEKVFETLFLIEGEMIAEWKQNNQIKTKTIFPGDMVETESTPHTFSNKTDKPARFIVIKQILSGINKRKIFKKDKYLD